MDVITLTKEQWIINSIIMSNAEVQEIVSDARLNCTSVYNMSWFADMCMRIYEIIKDDVDDNCDDAGFYEVAIVVEKILQLVG